MKSLIRNLLLPVAGLALGANLATAAPWPPAQGDLILGVQATGGMGSTDNLFFNLGPAHTLRDNPSPGTVVNLDAELTAAFGAGWEARTDLYFGLIANRSNMPPSGLGAVAPENGDPASTIYVSKAAATPGASIPWSGFNVTALASAATKHSGQIAALAAIGANGNSVATLSQGANPVQWNNGWSKWNPVPGAAFSIFTGGIQSAVNATVAHADVHRIVSTTGSGTYVTTVSLAANGDVTVDDSGAATAYFTVSGTAANGSIVGADGVTKYAEGSTARLTAVPNAGFGFVSWSGDASGSANPLNLPIDANKSVTANFAALPSVTSPTSVDITGTEATLGANVTGDGGQTIAARGIVYANVADNANPVLGGIGVSNETASGTTGVFTVPVSGLAAGTTYAYKGYATSDAGTGYSAVAFFTTDATLTLTGNTGSASGTIQPGDGQNYLFTLADAREVAISGGAAGLNAELFDASGNQIASGSGIFGFSRLLSAGTYRLRISNPTGSAAAFSFAVDATRTASARPAVTATPAKITSKKAKAVKGKALVRNTGNLPSPITVSASKGNGFFKVVYSGPGGNLTSALNAGRYQTPSLSSASAPVTITAKITPNKKKLLKKKKGQKVRVVKKTYKGSYRASAPGAPTAAGNFQVLVR